MSRLGIDIDGVVADEFSLLAKVLSRHLGRKVHPRNMTEFYPDRQYGHYGITHQVMRGLFEEMYASNEYANLPLVQGAYDGIMRLSENFILFPLTARPTFLSELTERYLQKTFPPETFEQPSYTRNPLEPGRRTKGEMGSSLGIHMHFDDHGDNILDVNSWNISGVLFHAPYNRGIALPNGSHRVKTWEAAVNVVENSLPRTAYSFSKA